MVKEARSPKLATADMTLLSTLTISTNIHHFTTRTANGSSLSFRWQFITFQARYLNCTVSQPAVLSLATPVTAAIYGNASSFLSYRARSKLSLFLIKHHNMQTHGKSRGIAPGRHSLLRNYVVDWSPSRFGRITPAGRIPGYSYLEGWVDP